MSEAGAERPEQGSEAQLIPITRGISLAAQVEVAGPTTLVVRPDHAESARSLDVKRGDRIEVFWRILDVGRSLPAQVEEIESGDELRWELRVTGPAEFSQRREAVRADVQLPARVLVNAAALPGQTIDLSEAGSRLVCDGWGLPPEPGAIAELVIELEDGDLTTQARVVRVQLRGARWFLSLKYLGTSEDQKNRLRRRVFQAMREERAAHRSD